ncbi:hypothetical protein RHGRI_011131 [Rhododendron griersonianum]|uniref:Uncharacterized protein n=1 Tax=Rhododendron griersonianum TaxID=479676 RepID=A0AAV6KLH7_9ERIC|nr:hypothetical protein RHGRI_011131 [Rhododendron griersonianum]
MSQGLHIRHQARLNRSRTSPIRLPGWMRNQSILLWKFICVTKRPSLSLDSEIQTGGIKHPKGC